MVIFTQSDLAIMPLDKLISECIKKYSPQSIFLREKGTSDLKYIETANKIAPICKTNNVEIFVCHRAKIAKELQIKNLHTSFADFLKLEDKKFFDKISVSVHSKEEAQLAQNLGATSLVFGHIFETNCKQGLAARGVGQLEDICKNVTIPVIAIGGINKSNCEKVLSAYASDFAVMSSAMKLDF